MCESDSGENWDEQDEDAASNGNCSAITCRVSVLQVSTSFFSPVFSRLQFNSSYWEMTGVRITGVLVALCVLPVQHVQSNGRSGCAYSNE